jgi:hypothetical protein
MLLPTPRERSDYFRSVWCRRPAPKGAAKTKKMLKVLVLAAILTVTLAVSPAQACACEVPDWSTMSDE